jgi:hypothetical protein
LKVGSAIFINSRFTPKSRLIVNYKNANPFDQNDKLRFVIKTKKASLTIEGIITGYSYGDYDFFADGNKYFGSDVNDKISTDVGGNQYAKISISVIKNNIERKYVDSIFCKPNELQYYDIKY